MQGLKAQKHELLFLIGAELIQVAVGQNEIILNFSNSASISIFSRVKLTYPSGKQTDFSDFSRSAAGVCELLGSSVQDFKIDESGRKVTLKFSSIEMSILDDSEQYESFVITFGDKVFVA